MILPDHLKEKIADPAERKRHGLTHSQSLVRDWLVLERKEHHKFLAHLERYEFAYIHSRTDKRTRQNLGVPDFLIGCRIGLAIEFKRRGGRLSPEQEEWRTMHEARGGIYHVVETYQEALDILKAFGL
jgi:hypothetical protein